MKDITELKKVDQMKKEFLSLVSHKLRTPLTPIKGYLSLLLSGQLGEISPQQKDALAIIANQSNHPHNLIDTVIDISRIEAGKPLELEKEPLFLRDAVGEDLKLMEEACRAKKIAVKTNFPSDRLSVLADKKKLQRAVENILGNALKFTPAGVGKGAKVIFALPLTK